MLKLTKVIINNTNKYPSKRFIGIFNDDTRTYFGLKNPKYGTYIDHTDKLKRDSYNKRHEIDLKTKNPKKAGYLSMFILWNKKTLPASIKDYNTRLTTNTWTIPN